MTTDATPMPSPQEPHPYLVYLAPQVPAAVAPVRGSGWRARMIAAVSTAVVVAALGFPLGWLWASLAPRLPTVVSNGDLFYVDPMGNQSAAEESWYALISIVAGVVIAILAWTLLRRVRGPLMLLALALGGGAAGWVMWRFGRTFGPSRDDARELAKSLPDGTHVNLGVDIRIQRHGLWHGFLPYIAGNLVYLAIAAVAVYAIIAGFTTYPDLIGRRRNQAPSYQPPVAPPIPGEQSPLDGPKDVQSQYGQYGQYGPPYPAQAQPQPPAPESGSFPNPDPDGVQSPRHDADGSR